MLAGLGPRLRALRRRAGLSLAVVAERTGVSVSTLSRLESGLRRSSLELLLPLAQVYEVPLDVLVNAPPSGDARLYPRPVTRWGMTVLPLTRAPGGLQAFTRVLAPEPAGVEPDPQSHEGYHWLYVLNGRLRVVLGDHDLELGAGEAVEFDTHLPHWMGNAGAQPVEQLSIVGPQGERFRLRARFRRH